MTASVSQLYQRPRSYTSAELLIDELRDAVFNSRRSYKQIATEANVALGTVHRLASGKTKWPRPETLFGVAFALGLTLKFTPLTTHRKH